MKYSHLLVWSPARMTSSFITWGEGGWWGGESSGRTVGCGGCDCWQMEVVQMVVVHVVVSVAVAAAAVVLVLYYSGYAL